MIGENVIGEEKMYSILMCVYVCVHMCVCVCMYGVCVLWDFFVCCYWCYLCLFFFPTQALYSFFLSFLIPSTFLSYSLLFSSLVSFPSLTSLIPLLSFLWPPFFLLSSLLLLSHHYLSSCPLHYVTAQLASGFKNVFQAARCCHCLKPFWSQISHRATSSQYHCLLISSHR